VIIGAPLHCSCREDRRGAALDGTGIDAGVLLALFLDGGDRRDPAASRKCAAGRAVASGRATRLHGPSR
jgi:hypothetical protein